MKQNEPLGLRSHLISQIANRNISLRLAALREAYEELGVLLGQRTGQVGESPSGYSIAIPDPDISSNQTAVHDNKLPFMELCQKLGIVPDVLNMYEWSVWLTPAMFRKRRFETAFYLVALDAQPEVHPEPHEVSEFMVSEFGLII